MAYKRIIIDTDILLVTINPEDAHFLSATKALTTIAAQADSLAVISSCVFQEFLTLVSMRYGREAAVRLTGEILAAEPLFPIIEEPLNFRNKVLAVYTSLKTKNLSYTDCLNIALVRAGYADAVLSFDQIYKTAKVAYDLPLS